MKNKREVCENEDQEYSYAYSHDTELKGTTANIVGKRNRFFDGSLVGMVIGLTFLVVNMVSANGAFNYDVEFGGGTQIIMDMGRDFNNDEIAAIVTENTEQTTPRFKEYWVQIKLQLK